MLLWALIHSTGGTVFACFQLFWLHSAGYALTPSRTLAAACGHAITYTADKLVANDEDKRGRSYDGGAFARHRRATACFLAACFAVFGACALHHPDLLVSSVLTSAITAFYVTPLPVVGKRIKTLFPLSKTVYVAGVAAVWSHATQLAVPDTPARWRIAALSALFVAHQTAAFDLKDVDADRHAGVVTLPTLLGADNAVRVLCASYVALGVACMCTLPALADGVSMLAVTLVVATCAWRSDARTRVAPNVTWQYGAMAGPWLLRCAARAAASAVRP
tara:strand:- start:10803 stop:11630 length:828 start_codon:yes stop_codon:yes gene_type:complete